MPETEQTKHMIIGRVTLDALNRQVNEHEDALAALRERVDQLEILVDPRAFRVNNGLSAHPADDSDSEPDLVAILEDDNTELRVRIAELEEEIAYLRNLGL